MVKIYDIYYFITYSRVIKLSTASELEDAKIPTLVKILATIKAIHTVQGFIIIVVVVYNAFVPMKQTPTFVKIQTVLNVTSEDEHEPYIERFNRILK